MYGERHCSDKQVVLLQMDLIWLFFSLTTSSDRHRIYEYLAFVKNIEIKILLFRM